MATNAEIAAMRVAIAAALTAGRTSPNPRVGCVVLDDAGSVVATGLHRGAGQPHAEVDALQAAGGAADGATVVVTLEPCNHTGRTGPCCDALIAAGVRRVVVARVDPNPAATGGIARLRAVGVEVETGLLADEADINHPWETAVRRGRPFVTWKVAASLDGRIAAADGSSQWITGPPARLQVQRLRRDVDAIAVGSTTALTDDPSLTARDEHGTPLARQHQPLRVVLGRRPLPDSARLLDDAADTVTIAERDPPTVLAQLWERDVRHLLLEGGGTIAAAWLRSEAIDEIHWYAAPMLLGRTGRPAAGLDVATLSDAPRWSIRGIDRFGDDVRLILNRDDREAV